MATDPRPTPPENPSEHCRGTEPRGPHSGEVDEASGGADSSPYENEPSASVKDMKSPPRGVRKDDAQMPQPADPRPE